jgi:uncharacterized phage protein (TIGR01671 family)
MREIKFRAWDKRFGVMSEVDSIGLNFGSGYTCYEGEPVKTITKEDIKGLNIHAGTEDSDIVLMQYTGLKDTNGKLIFEGDILRYKKVSILNDNITETLGVVEMSEYDDGEGCYNDNHLGWICVKGDENIKTLPDVAEWSEVIGNIYENPNLI